MITNEFKKYNVNINDKRNMNNNFINSNSDLILTDVDEVDAQLLMVTNELTKYNLNIDHQFTTNNTEMKSTIKKLRPIEKSNKETNRLSLLQQKKVNINLKRLKEFVSYIIVNVKM